MQNCEIFISEKRINFDYYYNFHDEGYYIIKYKFKKLQKKLLILCFMIVIH